MTPLIQSEAFFFISSIGFVIIGILLAVLIAIGIRVACAFMRILTKVEGSLDSVGDATLELIEEVRDSVVFRMFFQPKKKRPKRGIGGGSSGVDLLSK